MNCESKNIAFKFAEPNMDKDKNEKRYGNNNESDEDLDY